MKKIKGMITSFVILSTIAFSLQNHLEASVTYVTDTGGYAYDESRAATNLAPAIALSTVALAAIIAIGVQNSHGSSSHSSSSSSHYGSSSSSSSSSN
jgi:hypothetical protein